jgi:xanthine dehydrogenase small subunit
MTPTLDSSPPVPSSETDVAPRPIRFIHRGKLVSVDHVSPTRTLLDWLREEARCTGTKEGCNEGDCGACTVVLAELDGATDDCSEQRDGLSARPGGHSGDSVASSRLEPYLRLRAINACLRFLPTVDGCAVFTVEDLAEMAAPRMLHPVQQAMHDCHASQCGFCTPGFVMSLWAQYEAVQAGDQRPDRQALADALAGNLCRCTGYRPILDAGERMFEVSPAPLDRGPLIAALRALRSQAGGMQADFVYQPQSSELVRFTAPGSLASFARLRAARPQARVLAGATDMALWVNKQFRRLNDLIYIGRVPELGCIERSDAFLRIGAAVSLEQAWAEIAHLWPGLTEVWLRFAGPPVRQVGTLVGNLANGSPIGDGAPILMALGAELELRRGEHVRTLALEDFYLDYMKNALEPGEFVQAVRIPLPVAGHQVIGWKISKRYDSDISAVCLGASIRIQQGTVSAIRLAFGGMAATVRRALHTEQALLGRPWTRAAMESAQQALAQDFKPITDLRGSAAWRVRVAENLLERLWWCTRPDRALSDAQLRVFAQREPARTVLLGAG